MTRDRPCSIDGCPHVVLGGGDICALHRSRLRRGTPMNQPIQERNLEPKEAMAKAAIEYADAEEEDYAAAKAALARAAERFGISRMLQGLGGKMFQTAVARRMGPIGARHGHENRTKEQRKAKASAMARARWNKKKLTTTEKCTRLSIGNAHDEKEGEPDSEGLASGAERESGRQTEVRVDLAREVPAGSGADDGEAAAALAEQGRAGRTDGDEGVAGPSGADGVQAGSGQGRGQR